jgi:RimJ/RimL family protein N-acetyltransferase
MRAGARAQDGPGGRLGGWRPPPRPGPEAIAGRRLRLERLDPDRHGSEIHAALAGDDAAWDYLGYGPFAQEAAWRAWAQGAAAGAEPFFYALRDLATGRAGGVAAFLGIVPEMGRIELGHIALGAALRRSAAATEAWRLLMGWAFEAGYRRFEWKCDARNLASRRAAQRLGLSYEGLFRRHMIVKGRNRDTAWFAATDEDWPALRAALDAWLDPGNFDPAGRQRRRLSEMTAPLLLARDPALGGDPAAGHPAGG